MSSREKILAIVKTNQPDLSGLPETFTITSTVDDLVEKFIAVATTIGSKVLRVKSYDELIQVVNGSYKSGARIFSNIKELEPVFEPGSATFQTPHTFENIELSILQGQFGVAENSAIWLTEDAVGQRVLPFICQHLALIIKQEDIVANMHEAYARICSEAYGYATFIAGPSKTADIEQSLVLGAHGPRSLTIFLLD